MKKLLLPLFIFLSFFAQAQFNNSWIDYSKTYYKFHLSQDGLTRINQSVLASAGVGNIPAEQFQLWRNGQQVRIYTSVSTGALGAGGFLEFWGEKNDGKPDTKLYKNPEFQLSDKYSLETDTVAYFLTVNAGTGNLRFSTEANNAPGSMTPEPYFLRDVDLHYNSRINRGLALPFGQYLWSSTYDDGEGFGSTDIGACCPFNQQFPGLNLFNGAPANSLTVRVNAVGMAPSGRNLEVKVDGTIVYSQAMPLFQSRRLNLTGLSTSLLTNPNVATISVATISTTATDAITVATIGITYPATFNFNNEKNFSFSLQPSVNSRYLDIQNFNYGASAPVLLNMTTGARYLGNISTPARVKFVLPAAAAVHKFLLINVENPAVINALTTRNFTSFATAAGQGDFMIISHPSLYNDGSGNNYVDQYRQYRSSSTGGSYNAKIYDINELVDQFGFGIRNHPSSIRDFIHYANQQFTVKPKYVFLIGRGLTYLDYRNSQSSPLISKLDLIPTFGWPASDNLLSALPGTYSPVVPIGRLSVVNGKEINDYLDKLKQYDQAQQTLNPGIAAKSWMKNVLHVVGGSSEGENNAFRQYMAGYESIVKDTLFGGYVETFSKSTAGTIQQAASVRIKEFFEEGLGLISYFGHSSANTFEFNLSDPTIYNNAGKYPFFNVSGCNAGNFYVYDELRLSGNLTLSEKYLLTPQRGSIGFLADTHFGVPPQLNFFNQSFYARFGRSMYGNTVGNQIKAVAEELSGFPNFDFLLRIHLEQITLHGDPAVKINNFPKPDYAVEEPQIKISPSLITVADNSFNVSVKMFNLGRAVNDSIWVSVKRKLPNDSIKVLYNQLIKGIRNRDSINLIVLINPLTDKGLNQIIVELDHTSRVSEIFETNNKATKDFFVLEDELRPAFPYNFSIVNQQNITFSASTANPLTGVRQYTMEIDTTELFNSAFKKVYNASGPGGLVQFTPANITFTDSTVYYWRVSVVPVNSAAVIWNSFSFTYLGNSTPGFSQSHYYQFQKNIFSNITLQPNRSFAFNRQPRNLIIRSGMHPYFDFDDIHVSLDFDRLERYGCRFNSLQIYVFDSTTLLPWKNKNVSPTSGMFGSAPLCAVSADGSRLFFEFPYNTTTESRKAAMDFLDLIPAGKYVAIINLGNRLNNTTFINTWQGDQSTLGTGNSLYHKLRSIGFTKIDSFYRNIPFLYFYQKGVSSFAPTQVVGAADSTYIDQTFALNTTATFGTIESPIYGPVKKWESLQWKGVTTEPAPFTDTAKIQVFGIKYDGTSDLLTTVAPATDTSLGFINSRVYPFLKLKMSTKDTLRATPVQLKYLTLKAAVAAEGAVAPNVLFQMKDSVTLGEDLQFSLAFKNISLTKFDSLIKIKFIITDKDNVPHIIDLPRGKALVAGDTLSVRYTIDTRNYPGSNTLFIEFNPDNDQPEQYHFNNVLYKDFFVNSDRFNPLMDVTFDGVHILNRDIVSSRPSILIKLKDESTFLALRDTALIQVTVRYPDQSLRRIYFGDTLRFTPANLASGENTATINFNPNFLMDGEYELIVSGKDAAGNRAGSLDYKVVFNIINKPMISNLLNYPNPFTTSTAFLFTITGTEIPQNMRIQIMTITGKIVREITKQELGPLQIGRNITEFKWDGTDMYGQKLANGVYLYRVLTNLNGKRLDKFDGRNSNGEVVTDGISGTDKYFNKGYGKMYLMR